MNCCCYWYQRYLILKAIHNLKIALIALRLVVTDIKDTSFWKQFTTKNVDRILDSLLLLISKIPHFESNSQLSHGNILEGYVVTDIKDTSFWKQFTTCSIEIGKACLLLLISKIPHFESNSQRYGTRFRNNVRCYWYQRYLILKAIHNSFVFSTSILNVVTDIKDTSFWKQFTTVITNINRVFSCYWYQRYLILKAIHNKH